MQFHVREVVLLAGSHSFFTETPVELDALLIQAACEREVTCHSRGDRLHVQRHLLELFIPLLAREDASLLGEGTYTPDVTVPERHSRKHAQRIDLGLCRPGRSCFDEGLLAELASAFVVPRAKRCGRLFVETRHRHRTGPVLYRLRPV